MLYILFHLKMKHYKEIGGKKNFNFFIEISHQIEKIVVIYV